MVTTIFQGLLVAVAPAAEAGTGYFDEEWDSTVPSTAWTYSPAPTAGQDCTSNTYVTATCSLQINAQVANQVVSATRPLSIAVTDHGYRVSYDFYNKHVLMSTSWVNITTAGGLIRVANGYGPGNQFALFTNTAGTGAFYTYNEKTWYRVVVDVDLDHNTVHAEVRTLGDVLLASSPSLAAPAGASTITGAGIFGNYFGTDPIGQAPQAAWYDSFSITGPDAPSAPSASASIGPGLGNLTVSWNAPGDDGGLPVSSYHVYAGNTSSNVTTLVVNTTARTFTEGGFANGVTRYYKVKAVNAMGEGAASSIVSARTYSVPDAPGLNALGQGGVGQIALSWSAPFNGGAAITNYNIYRANASGAETFLAQIGSNQSYIDAHLPNGSVWYYRVSATNFVGESALSVERSGSPTPDQASKPIVAQFGPDPSWSGGERTLNFTYTLADSQCDPSLSCPVGAEWRAYMDGSPTGPDGTLLGNGTVTHSGHAETTTYNVGTIVKPTGLDGTHWLKVAVNARNGSTQWWVSDPKVFQIGVPQPDPVCAAAGATAAYYTYLMPGVATPAPGLKYGKPPTGYVLNNTLVPANPVFEDGCKSTTGSGDGIYEIGYGGIVMNGPLLSGTIIQLPDSTGHDPTFVMGTEGSGDSILGDSPLDCIQGPVYFAANLTCAVGPTGHLFILPLPPAPGTAPQDQPIWGRGVSCSQLVSHCMIYYCGPADGVVGGTGQTYGCNTGAGGGGRGVVYQFDGNHNGMGDGFEDDVNQTATKNKQAIDAILGPLQDQEFASPCTLWNCLNTPRSGDGLRDVEEFRWLTDPIGVLCPPGLDCIFPNARDHDQDHWEDGPEHAYWNDPSNDAFINSSGWTTINVAPLDPDENTTVFPGDAHVMNNRDADHDGWYDGDEYTTYDTYPEHWDSDCLSTTSCRGPQEQAALNSSRGPYQAAIADPDKPGTGDLMNDPIEYAAWADAGPDMWQRGLGPNAWKTDFDHDGIRSNLLDGDADGDGLLDGNEFVMEDANGNNVGGHCAARCTSPALFDTDHDGLLDGADVVLTAGDARFQDFVQAGVVYEAQGDGTYRFFGEASQGTGTDPTNPDSDGDGLPDGWEVRYRLNPLVAADASLDPDHDDLSNLQEYSYRCKSATSYPCPAIPVNWNGTDPTNPDTDADGLTDGQELNAYGTKPLEPDTDLDGLTDGQEVLVYHTNPRDIDTDRDGLTDYQEAVTYASRGVSPLKANSDDSQNATGAPSDNNDTLTDYQEIVQYGTNPSGLDTNHDNMPDGWDTDGDGMADGRDSNPTRPDSHPMQTNLTPINGLGNQNQAYVLFRERGYVDVMVYDAHGAEADIAQVEVTVQLNGTVDGTTGSVLVREVADRLDDGNTWGARIPLPQHMSEATSEWYTLTIVSTEGNYMTFVGGDTQPIHQVQWNADSDPTDINGDWEQLIVHQSNPETPQPRGTQMNAPRLPDPRNLSIDQLFQIYGNFSINRLKPFSFSQQDLSTEPNTTAFGLLTPINVTLADPTGNATGNETVAFYFNGTFVSDAFEHVDPLQEPGLYMSLADGGDDSFRTPRWLYAGIQKGWDILSSNTASFFFGSDNPHAHGQVAGDIVAGILLWGSIRDIIVGSVDGKPVKVALGAIGAGLWWVGPEAEAPYALFETEVKQVVLTPDGEKAGGWLVNELNVALSNAKATGDAKLAIRSISELVDVAKWLALNPNEIGDFLRLTRALDGATIRETRGALDDMVALSKDVGSAAADDPAAVIIIKDFDGVTVYYPLGKGYDDLSGVMGFARRGGCGTSNPNCAGQIGAVTKSLHDLKETAGAGNAWNGAWRKGLMNNQNGRWGYMWEILVCGKLSRGELSFLDEAGNTIVMRLDESDRTLTVSFADGSEVSAQFDALGIRSSDGKIIGTEMKTGVFNSDGGNWYDQMDRQLQVMQKNANDQPGVYAKEIHWRFDRMPDQGAIDNAKTLQAKYPDMKIRLFDQNGAQVSLV